MFVISFYYSNIVGPWKENVRSLQISAAINNRQYTIWNVFQFVPFVFFHILIGNFQKRLNKNTQRVCMKMQNGLMDIWNEYLVIVVFLFFFLFCLILIRAFHNRSFFFTISRWPWSKKKKTNSTAKSKGNERQWSILGNFFNKRLSVPECQSSNALLIFLHIFEFQNQYEYNEWQWFKNLFTISFPFSDWLPYSHTQKIGHDSFDAIVWYRFRIEQLLKLYRQQ